MARGTNLYELYLRLLEASCVFPNIDRVLQPIGEAIAISTQDVEAIYEGITEDHLDAITEEETDVVENLIGVAFVVCQTYISAVISGVCALHRLYEKEHKGERLKTPTSGEKPDIMAFGSSRVGNSRFSHVQVINAFANYFKHREEWVVEWDKLKDNARTKITVQIISAVGASWGSTANLRTGAEVLGNESYSDTSIFVDILQSWRQSLLDAYRKELESKHLIFVQPSRPTSASS